MNKLEHLLKQLQTNPEQVRFKDVIDVIDRTYQYTPVRFTNGPIDSESADFSINDAGENEGSCKIFSFALMNSLDESKTLHCFGDHYRKDVLLHPYSTDHANIRTFIRYGWQHIRFDAPALTESRNKPEQQ